MPVKVGGSYVSEAAYSFAKAQATDNTENSAVTKSLAEKFPNLKFSVGTKPFSGTGMNNVSISPKILKQMEKDPEKRLEYEALIYDIAHTDVQSGRAPEHKLKSHGFIIEDDGGLRSWGISEYNDGNRRQQAHVKRSDKKNWWQELLAKQPKKKKKKADAKVLQEKLAEKKEVGFQGMNITIDEDGEMTMTSSKRTVSINEEKRRRQIAAAATQNDMQAVLAILQQDLQEYADITGFDKSIDRSN